MGGAARKPHLASNLLSIIRNSMSTLLYFPNFFSLIILVCLPGLRCSTGEVEPTKQGK